MAKRGVLSTDPTKVARREWYAQMQLEVFKKGDMDELALELEADRKPSRSKLKRTEKQSIVPEAGDSKHFEESEVDEEEKVEEKPLFANMPQFSNFALDLAEESLRRQEERDNVVEKEPEIVPFDKPDDITPHRWIIPLNKLPLHSTAKCKLVCIPGIGSSHLIFKKWGAYFEELGIELFGVCLPNHAHRFREEPMEYVHDIAECIADSMVALQLVDPNCIETEALRAQLIDTDSEGASDEEEIKVEISYRKCVLFGHSVGGIIAFETTRYLQEQYGVILTDVDDDNYANEDVQLRKDVTNTICHLVVSSVEDPRALSKTNRDRFNTKWFCGSVNELTNKVYSMGLMDKSAMNRIFQKRSFEPIIDIIRNDFRILEKYWLRGYQWKVDSRIGSAPGGSRNKQSTDDLYAEEDVSAFQVTCPIFCVSAEDDDFLNHDRVYDWYQMSTAFFKQYIFPRGKHVYFHDCALDGEYDASERSNSNILVDMLRQICLFNDVELDGDEDSCDTDSETETVNTIARYGTSIDSND